jgi:1,6-anhydro-N-acetylmuramate kinase
MNSPRTIAGCMTGTSIDALDAALVQIDGRGLALRARVLRCATQPLGELTEPLRRFAQQQPLTAGQIADLSLRFAQKHVATLRALLGPERADLVVVHGQTVFHAPPLSWQLMNPAPIAAALETPVMFDLRAADLAACGQGAPITPLADYVLFRDRRETRAVVNLGGFANFTLLPAGATHAETRGGDICACNQLLDALARELLAQPFDRDGRAAQAGAVHAAARDALRALLARQATAGRALGTGDEILAWLDAQRGAAAPHDLLCSACDALGAVIARAVAAADRVLIAGGGARNAALCAALSRHAGKPVQPTDFAGVPQEYREAAAMAVLGALCQDGVPITLPGVTRPAGAAPLAGMLCPAPRPRNH